MTLSLQVRPLLAASALALCPLACASASAQVVDPSLRWSFATLSTSAAGNILSSPSVADDGTVYIGIEVGSSTSLLQSGRLFAIRPDGTQKWVFSAPDWIDSSPAIAADGTVVFGCWDGRLYALAPDGTLKWSVALGSFISASPALGPDGTAYVGTGDGDLVAVRPDGSIAWTYMAGDWIDASPAIAADGTLYFGSWDRSLYAVRPDGTGLWRYPTGGAILGAPAIAADGTIVFGSRDLNLHALAPDGTLRWTAGLGDTIEASPAIAPDGTIVAVTTGGRVFSLAPDGTERWRYPRAGTAPLDPLYSSPALRADGSIVFGSSGNALLVLNADGTLRSKATLGDWADSSALVAHDGSLYIGCSDKKLYAFVGAHAPLLSGWPQHRRDPQRNAWQPLGAASGTTGRLANLSVRTRAGTGDDTLIVGFVVEGAESKPFLVRGIGPALANFGVEGALADPRIVVYRSGDTIAGNDNWGSAPNLAALKTAAAAVSAFALPEGSRDAALLQAFPGGGYTVQVAGADGGTGIALMEVYDAGGTGGTRLVNVSARSAVGTGADLLIAGFVVSGGTRSLLVRAAGPALADFGVEATLADPLLRLFRGTRAIAENDDWSATSQAAAIEARAREIFAFPLANGSRDAALLVTLPPGNYSVQVSGAGAVRTGVGLVELYELR